MKVVTLKVPVGRVVPGLLTPTMSSLISSPAGISFGTMNQISSSVANLPGQLHSLQVPPLIEVLGFIVMSLGNYTLILAFLTTGFSVENLMVQTESL